MLELEQALEQILAATPRLEAETIPVASADGRVLGERVVSTISMPPFDNSAMDGYAVRAADVAGASAANPVALRLAGQVAAGTGSEVEVTAGTCVRVFTGSFLPKGADAVVMQEDTQVAPNKPQEVRVLDTAKPWENVRFRGEDIKPGTVLCEAGERLGAAKLALLASAGVREIKAGRRPVVGVLATGSELREAGQALEPGQIYESNRPALAAMLQRCGAIPKVLPLVPDTLAATREALEKTFAESDMVLTSGGASVGDLDFVKAAFEEIGGRMNFWRVAMKPGKPFIFGQLGNRLLCGLPGNPVSALVTFLLLVRPAVLRMQGAVDVAPRSSLGELAEPLANRGDRRHFVRVVLDQAGLVRSAGVQASNLLGSLAAANCLLDVRAGETLAPGQRVRVLQWD